MTNVESAESLSGRLNQELDRARAIGTAVGIVMAGENVSYDDALGQLNRSGQYLGLDLWAVAARVAMTGVVP